MSAANAPFGLRAVASAGGTPANLVEAYTIASGYSPAGGGNLGEGDPVKLSGGKIIRAVGVIGSDTSGILGVFMGCEYTDTNGRNQKSNQWVAGTATFGSLDAICYVSAFPFTTYEVQANAAVNVADIGGECDLITAASALCNTTTGLSQQTLDRAGAFSQSGAAKLFRIVGITSAPDNAPGDAFTIVRVQIAKHQFTFGALTSPNGIA